MPLAWNWAKLLKLTKSNDDNISTAYWTGKFGFGYSNKSSAGHTSRGAIVENVPRNMCISVGIKPVGRTVIRGRPYKGNTAYSIL